MSGKCYPGNWVDARWYKGKGYCEGSLVDKHMGCLPTTTKDACTGNCVCKTYGEITSALSALRSIADVSESAMIKAAFFSDLFQLSIPGIDAKKNDGACMASGLWDASFDAIVAKGVRANNGSDEYDYRAIYRATQGDLLGTCSAGAALSKQYDCEWASTNQTACSAVGSYCEYLWYSPTSGYCSMVNPLLDPSDSYYKSVMESENTCYKATAATCATTGGTFSTGVTPWETLLSALPSYATGGTTDGTPSPAPKPKPTGGPGKKGTAAPPPRRRFRLFPPFRRAPRMARTP
ncbi:hypothetical protein HYH03_008797 [Edaphochlamys debaryana]|uniref:Uncharacterized protein n=1 Tax=Edaphochlamys debaryana TaxID=47281 RepID=A0A836BYD8_9CHLO|nr:hypothetical protein HYH03_008797 [Edaphochlamys debaryana]|eukprot:KAG2492882.1 hypothetical protein HYH03_008797 [Edaphochlamys debaryana]